MIAKKNQECAECQHCDGYACLKLDVWIDGKIKVDGGQKNRSKKDKNYIPIITYGKKYCPHFKPRNA